MSKTTILKAATEAMMTREEAIAWAEELYDNTREWPSNRFRVEESAVGPSRLITSAEADRMQKKYGGKVVELIPSHKQYKLDAAHKPGQP